MSDTKWTPAEWRYRKGGGHATFYVEGPSEDGNAWLVAEVSGRSLGENAANAALIARAPEMAHELKAQANVLDNIAACESLDIARGVATAQAERVRALLAELERGR